MNTRSEVWYLNNKIKGRLVTERLSEHKLSPQLAAEIARKRVTELEEVLNNTVEQVDVSRFTMAKLIEDLEGQTGLPRPGRRAGEHNRGNPLSPCGAKPQFAS